MAKQPLSSRPCGRQTGVFSQNARVFVSALIGLLSLTVAHSAIAEVLSSTTPFIRIRLGDNVVGSTNTVVYNAGVPADMGGLPGVAAEPATVSTNAVSGGSGVFEVRVVTDLNARNGLTSLTGVFAYDSSQPMICTTPATCGAETIGFSQVRWNIRDNDTHTSVTQFDGTANQIANTQVDTDPERNRQDTRHRNYFQYIFDNATLLPAGTYEGVITLNGTGTP